MTQVLGFPAVRKTMDSLSNIQPLFSPKSSDAVANRVVDSFGGEIASLLAATVAESLPNPANLGANIDVKA